MGDNSKTLDSAATTTAFLAVLALGLAAGALLAEGAVLVPFWRSLAPDAFLAWYGDNAALLFNFFAPLEIAAAVLAVAAAALYRVRRRPGGGLLIAAAALALAILIAFPLLFKEVNAGFAAGTVALDRVGEELARWAWWHWLRTATALAAFAAALLAVRQDGGSPPR